MIENECCICYVGDGVMTSCNHCICKQCVLKLLINSLCVGNRNHSKCPICRKELEITCYYNKDYCILNYDTIFIKIEVPNFLSGVFLQTDGNSIFQRSFDWSGGLIWGRQVDGRLTRYEKFCIHHPVHLKSIVCKTQ